MICSSISDEVVASGTREESGLVVRRVGGWIRSPGYRASMVITVAKWEWADCHIVGESVPHLITILQVKIGTADIVQNITLDFGLVGIMNDDSTLLRVLDGIIFKETFGAFSHFVKMQTILSLNSCR